MKIGCSWVSVVCDDTPLFSVLNLFVCVIPACQRFMKFLHKSAEEREALPADTPRYSVQQPSVAIDWCAAHSRFLCRAEIILNHSFVFGNQMTMLFGSLPCPEFVEQSMLLLGGRFCLVP